VSVFVRYPDTEARITLFPTVADSILKFVPVKNRLWSTDSFLRIHLVSSKAEIDVSWTGDAVPKRSFSLSCSVVKSTILDALPPGYSAMAKDCESKVERYKAGGLKIERWVLPEGKLVFEVSMEGEDTQADLERFETQVVKPLLEQKMAPMKETKTELGGQC